MKMTYRFFTALLALWVGLPLPLAASETDVVSLTLVPGWQAEDGTHVAGLAIALAPGWKTYWRSPGDAGIPPLVDFSRSTNLAKGTVEFPAPTTFDINGMTSVGYTSDVIFPLLLTPEVADSPMHVEAHVMLGVCKDICVPFEITVAADLLAGIPYEGTSASDLRDALTARPTPSDAALTCQTEMTASGQTLTTQLTLPASDAAEFAIIELADREIWVSEAQTTRQGDALTVSVSLEHVGGHGFTFDPATLRLTLLTGPTALDLTGCD
jgi:DsbC/DsbD-like thiol-disulfide interchange protein